MTSFDETITLVKSQIELAQYEITALRKRRDELLHNCNRLEQEARDARIETKRVRKELEDHQRWTESSWADNRFEGIELLRHRRRIGRTLEDFQKLYMQKPIVDSSHRLSRFIQDLSPIRTSTETIKPKPETFVGKPIPEPLLDADSDVPGSTDYR